MGTMGLRRRILSHEDELLTRLFRTVAILLLIAAVTIPAIADKAKSLFNKGRDAEDRQNYEEA